MNSRDRFGREHEPATDDGFLQLYEIYDLKLPSVELAVLSACKTDAGTSIDGEGVITLARGFHAAGAQRVVGSQWDVEDRSTALLVGTLFQRIAAGERSGRAGFYSSALQSAKRAVRSDAAHSRWADPYYWAPFILSGIR